MQNGNIGRNEPCDPSVEPLAEILRSTENQLYGIMECADEIRFKLVLPPLDKEKGGSKPEIQGIYDQAAHNRYLGSMLFETLLTINNLL